MVFSIPSRLRLIFASYCEIVAWVVQPTTLWVSLASLTSVLDPGLLPWLCLTLLLEPWDEVIYWYSDSLGFSLKWHLSKIMFHVTLGLASLISCCSSQHPLLHSTGVFLFGSSGITHTHCISVDLNLLSHATSQNRGKVQFAIFFSCFEHVSSLFCGLQFSIQIFPVSWKFNSLLFFPKLFYSSVYIPNLGMDDLLIFTIPLSFQKPIVIFLS